MRDITLQINLSPGDINYAEITVPALVKAHRSTVGSTLAIVDCCRPQRTKVLDPDERFPEPGFSQRVEQICSITDELKSKGYFDQVIYLYSDDPIIPLIQRKYLRNLVQGTHDFRGAGFMSYFAGIEIPETRYVLHYDCDMLLYQAPNYDWSLEAITLMNQYPHVIAAVPRTSPPFAIDSAHPDAPSLHEGRPFTEVEGGWLNDWFNTQCFVIDKDKLSNYLPLIQGRTFLQFLVFKYIQRTLPKSPEMMLIRQVGGSGGRRLVLKSKNAWIVHPLTKPSRYIELLPLIQQAIHAGKVPEEQKGRSNIELSAWETFLAQSSLI